MLDLKIQVEKYEDVIQEIKPLFVKHWEEIALYTDKIELDPDYSKYLTLEELGMLNIITARCQGKLVGYVILFIQPHLHYQKDLWCSMDIIYLDKPYRKAGYGAKLIQEVESLAKQKEASVIMFSTKVKQPFDKLMSWTGYELVERVYSKCIKD